MKDELGNWGAVCGMVILFLLFCGLALAIYPGWVSIGDWLSRADAPAWVQAIGSLLGILIAVCVPAWQRWDQRKSDLLDAYASAEFTSHQVMSYIQTVVPGMRALHKRASAKLDGPSSNEYIILFTEVFNKSVKPSDSQLIRLLPIAGNPAAKLSEAFGWIDRVLYLYSFHISESLGEETTVPLVEGSLDTLLKYSDLLDEAYKDMKKFLKMVNEAKIRKYSRSVS